MTERRIRKARRGTGAPIITLLRCCGEAIMPKASAAAPSGKVLLYEKVVATIPGVERKGATIPYTSLNGHMFSYLSKQGEMALRLPTNERELFLKKYKTKLCDSYGVIQPEYVVVPDSLLSKPSELKRFFDISYKYVGSLKPKPVRKKTEGKI
jgi:hypothetical protein